MRKFYQTEWLGLELQKVTETSIFSMAGKVFYDEFYRSFYNHYSSYDELPKNYIENKTRVANHLVSFIKDKDSVLSIGIGIGLIEYKLSKLLQKDKAKNVASKLKITAIEPSVSVVQWVDSDFVEIVHGFFPEAVDHRVTFDLAYAILIDYALDDSEYLSLLKNIVERKITEVYFSISVDNPLSVVNKLKHLLLLLLCTIGIKKCGQLWGYLRAIEEHKLLFKKAGFKTILIGQYSDGQYWIHAKL